MLNLKKNINSDLTVVCDRIKENDVKRKLVELDLTKRILKIEMQQDKVEKNIHSLDNLENLNELVSNAKEIKTKLRAIEDLKFLERLEVVETQENINTLTDSFAEMKEKVDLVTEAIKNIKNLKVPGNQNTANSDELVSKLTTKVDWIENKLNELATKKMDLQNLDNFKKDISKITSDISELSKQTDGTFKLLQSGMDAQSHMLKQTLKRIDSFEDVKSQAASWNKFADMQRKVNDKFDDILENVNSKIKKNTDELNGTFKHAKEFNSDLKKYKLNDIGTALDKINSVDKLIDAKFDECLKPAMDEELKDVVENVHTLLKEVNDINSNTENNKENEYAKLTKTILNSKKDNIKKIIVLEEKLNSLLSRMSDIETVQDKEYPTLAEVQELSEKLAKLEIVANDEFFLEKDFDEYRKAFESKVAVLEKRIDSFKDNNKEMESLVSLKTQEVSKNTFEKINNDLKPLVERVNELTDDVDVVKELRSEILDDVKHILDLQKSKEKKDVKSIMSQFDTFKSELNQLDLKEQNSYTHKLKKLTNDTSEKINDIETQLQSVQKTASDVQVSVKKDTQELISNVQTEFDKKLNHTISKKLESVQKEISNITNNGLVQKVDSIENELDEIKNNGVALKIQAIEKQTDNLKQQYDKKLNEKLKEFDAHINKLTVMTGSFSKNISSEVNKKIAAVEKENEILRNELNQLKEAYFQMIQLQQQSPVIIE